MVVVDTWRSQNSNVREQTYLTQVLERGVVPQSYTLRLLASPMYYTVHVDDPAGHNQLGPAYCTLIYFHH